MDTCAVRLYFDKAASHWDENIRCRFDVVDTILDCAGICKGDSVLDVGCGTGFMFPFYAFREARHVTGIDLSPEMVRIAAAKNTDSRVSVICGDAISYSYDRTFDRIVIYNALPHFVDFTALFNHLSLFLKDGGSLTVAHSMSLEELDKRHAKVMDISRRLPDADVLAKLFPSCFDMRYVISDSEKYIVSGIKRSF